MPVYELFCLARPGLAKQSLTPVIEKAGKAVFGNGGVLTDIRSYGDRELAYPIRKAGSKFSEAAMWQMSFLVGPSALPDINYNLHIDEDVLRWIVVKKRQHPVRPNTHDIAKTAEKKLSEQHVHMLDREQQHVAPH